jgi:hypothetical protein
MSKYIVLMALVALQAAAGPQEESAEARKEAKDILIAAWEQSRAYCEEYPTATHVVTVKGKDYAIEVTVKCEIVNLYFAGALE